MQAISMKCPYRYKYELVWWIVKYHHIKFSKANSMTKKQLYYFYYNPDKLAGLKQA